MADIENTLREQVGKLSFVQLGHALDWHVALAEHADENMRHADYHREQLIVTVLRQEMARRAVAASLSGEP